MAVGVFVSDIQPQHLQQEIEALFIHPEQAMIFSHVLVLEIILEQINHPFTHSKPHIIIVHLLFHTIDHYRSVSDDS